MRRIGILLSVLLLWGCAAPQIAMEEQATPALTPAPVSEPTPAPEPTPTPLPSLPPHSERVYLRDFDPPGGVHSAAFTGKPLTRLELARFSILLEAEHSWVALYECLEAVGASLEPLAYLTPEYGGYNPVNSESNALYAGDIQEINDTFAVIRIGGYIGGGSDECFLYFTREGEAYRPYIALQYYEDWPAEYLEWNGDTWMILRIQGSHGSGYDERSAVWYNLSKRKLCLQYTSLWLDAFGPYGDTPAEREITDHVTLVRKLETEAEPPIAYEGGAFAMDVHADISVTFDYYDDDWESEDDWRDVLEKRFTYRLYYDPEAQDFFLAAGNAEPYFIRAEFLQIETVVRMEDVPVLFWEELTELGKDELSYRADWAKLLLGEMDEGGGGDEG